LNLEHFNRIDVLPTHWHTHIRHLTPAISRFKLNTDDEWLFWTDALGVGVFAAAGANAAYAKEVQWWGCAVAGPSLNN